MTPSSPTTPARPAPAGAAPGPTHGCARCGDPVPAAVGLCERCNPLGLKDVAASQAHGTVFVAVAMAIVIMAVVARLAVSGAGPYPATIDEITPGEGGLGITLTVTNEGSSIGQTTCRIHDPVDQGGGPSAFVVSPRIEPRATVTFRANVTEFGSTGRAFAVECRTP